VKLYTYLEMNMSDNACGAIIERRELLGYMRAKMHTYFKSRYVR